MKINMLALLALLGVMVTAQSVQGTAWAEEKKSGKMEAMKERAEKHKKMFEESDTDKDGALTKKEWLDAHEKRAEEMFKKIDQDNDDKLTQEELAEGHKKFREEMKEKMKERREEFEERKSSKEEKEGRGKD